ncbi:MAG: hypothetical protein ACI3XI_02020 [Eubacteriales bacterium]
MTKALFKKQLMEVFSWLYKDRKTGKLRSAQGIVAFAVLYLILFGILGSMFYAMAEMLCTPLLDLEMGWMYWCLMGLIGVFLGVFGSVFNTYSSLYCAKDNDLLLSMPIPVSRILLVRLFGVYAIGLMYELIVMVPAVLVWFIRAPFSPVGAVCVVLIPLLLSVLVLVLSAVLGWVVALVAGKLKHKNIITVILSLAFIAVYYYVYGKATEMLGNLLANADAVGEKMRSVLYPLYQMGLAAEGNALSMLIFTVIIGALFAAVYAVLSHSFLRLATANRGSAKVKYNAKAQKAGSVESALLKKELRRFLGSANYMLNCGLGIIFMPTAAVLLCLKANAVREVLSLPFLESYVPLLAVAAVCMVASMNDITAPSVSLEGKNLWIAHSLPVTGRQVLAAKLKLHLILTVIPAIPLVAVVEWLIRPDLPSAVLIPIAIIAFIVLMATLGLCINLKAPNLDWTSEIVPIKQSMSVLIALFGGWVMIMALGGLYLLLKSVVSPVLFLVLACVLLFSLSAVALRWLFTRGERIFAAL